ncbi:MAG: UDP-N-acetylmuramate dehydrogenase [Clostridiales bacterium]|jgi:UDP-N-acetylmuramate dehydrogenase|nr:UDP-N-acetylmuramate dehydrogenase [Clostridiales bacterium]
MPDTLNFLRNRFGSAILVNEPMKNHTSFKTGGDAAFMMLAQNSGDIADAVSFCRENSVPFLLMGNGTNLLVSDSGFNGLVIKIAEKMSGVFLNTAGEIEAGAGLLLSELSHFALTRSLSGLEFASGIPGSVGGAVYMNAGAYGGEISGVLVWADIILNGEIKRFSVSDLALGYRASILQKNGGIVTAAAFKLVASQYSEIDAKIKELNAKRREKQPLNKPSAGSAFKRPEGHYAGKLIADSGLAGYKIGGAAVSEKHCGFIVNEGGASSSEIYALINYVKKTVFEKFGVALEPEVKFAGVFE